MGAIQSSLNQLMLTTLGATHVLGQTPAMRERAATKHELGQLNKQLKTLDKAEGIGELPADKQEKIRAIKEQAATRAFEIDPSEKSFAEMKRRIVDVGDTFPAYESLMEYYGTPDYQAEIAGEVESRQYQQLREQDIQQRLAQAYQSKQGVKDAVKKRRSFIEAMRNEPVRFGKGSDGSTFGDLPASMQKQIGKQYKANERKKVMDKYYGKE